MSSKKKLIGTSSTRDRSYRREAPTRFTPRSYFWTCWKVRPSASPNRSCDMPMRVRRKRIREPTCTSIGLGRLSTASAPGASNPGALRDIKEIFPLPLPAGAPAFPVCNDATSNSQTTFRKSDVFSIFLHVSSCGDARRDRRNSD